MSKGYDPNQPRDKDGKWTDSGGTVRNEPTSREDPHYKEWVEQNRKNSMTEKEWQDRQARILQNEQKAEKRKEYADKRVQDAIAKKEYAERLADKRFEMNMRRGAGIERPGEKIDYKNFRPTDTNLGTLSDVRKGDIVHFPGATGLANKGNLKIVGWRDRLFLAVDPKDTARTPETIEIPFSWADYIYIYHDDPNLEPKK